MKPKSALILLAVLIMALISALATFNYTLDPLCYFRCESITLKRASMNSYYETAQRIFAYPEAQFIVLGSSRGESLPLAWLTHELKLPGINLSVGGADFYSKSALLSIAKEKLKLTRVIWLADFFEFMPETTSQKLLNTKPLRERARGLGPESLRQKLNRLTLLTDHNTTAASFAYLKKRRRAKVTPDAGANSGMDEAKCREKIQNTPLTQQVLQKEVNLIYDGYSRSILRPKLNAQMQAAFRAMLHEVSAQGILITIVIPPYHPDFTARLAREYPEILARHEAWLAELRGLQSGIVEIRDYFKGIPGDTGTSSHWHDGVHFNCAATMQMLLPPGQN
jgi:hypothetical protein